MPLPVQVKSTAPNYIKSVQIEANLPHFSWNRNKFVSKRAPRLNQNPFKICPENYLLISSSVIQGDQKLSANLLRKESKPGKLRSRFLGGAKGGIGQRTIACLCKTDSHYFQIYFWYLSPKRINSSFVRLTFFRSFVRPWLCTLKNLHFRLEVNPF